MVIRYQTSRMGGFALILLGAVWSCYIFQPANAIIAYDCGMPSMNYTILSLNRVKECNIPIAKPVTVNTKIQLLQAAEFAAIRVRQCKIEIHRSIFHCGMHSHISAVANGEIQYIEEVNWETCKMLHQTRTYKTHAHVFTQITPNQTNTRPITLAGKLDGSGNCKGGHFSDYYGSWDDVVAYGQIFITLQDYYASVNLREGEVILRSGIRCNYLTGSCLDLEGGNTYWEIIQSDSCKFNRYTVLYEGPAQRIKDNDIDKYGQEIYSVTDNEITFALAVRGQVPICGYKLIKTEHPRLFILDRSDGDFFARRNGIQIANMDLITYVNSKIIHLEKHLRKQIVSLYNDIITQQCKIEVKILQNMMSIAHLAPAEFAYQLMKLPGYIANVAGEVVRISKCIPVEVTTRKTDFCYQELPVTRGNQSMFMSPRTHILINSGNQIDCNMFLSPIFQLNNAWYQLNPNPSLTSSPQEISPETKQTWKYESPDTIATGGIYSPEDLEKLHKTMMFPLERPAILNSIAREATGQFSADDRISMNHLIDENAIQKTIERTWHKLNNFFSRIGTIGTTLLGVWMVVRAIKFFIDTIVHGYTLHTIYGWSIHLIGAIWDSITHLLVQLGRKNKSNNDEQPPGNNNSNNGNLSTITNTKSEHSALTTERSALYPAISHTEINQNESQYHMENKPGNNIAISTNSSPTAPIEENSCGCPNHY